MTNELQKPTLAWKKRMEEGDDLLTAESIEATDRVLDRYVQQLDSLRNPTEIEIQKCIEHVVVSLNELNEEYEEFIETMEREELYLFIVSAAAKAGLESDEDLTEEWREW